MTKGRAAKALKQGRIQSSKTQQQLAMEFCSSRELISHYETEKTRVQPEVSRYFITKYNNPWVALESANEFIGWGVTRLDGPAVDLHRSSVKDKTLEELEEAIQAIHRVKTSIHPDYVQSFQRQDIEQSIQELMDVISASATWIATACEEYGFSWQEEWDKHNRKLIARNYVRG